jgi:hypothetical protein
VTNWGAALVAIVVALIAAAAGFVGAYLGSRWQAKTNLAQWRREKLLEYCSDLVAGSNAMTAVIGQIEGGTADSASAEMHNLLQAYGAIALLSVELQPVAKTVVDAQVASLSEARTDEPMMDEVDARVARALTRFTLAARDILNAISEEQSTPQRMWSRVPAPIAIRLTNLAIWIGLVAEPTLAPLETPSTAQTANPHDPPA